MNMQVRHAELMADASGNPNSYPGGVVDFLRSGDVVLTATQARAITEHCVHEIQEKIRPLDHKDAREHIAVLASIMETSGAWLDETQIRLGILYGRIWCMDGNHRIRAQANADVDIRWNIKIDYYSDEAEFRAAFHKFNTNSRSRTNAQILNAAGFSSNHGISKQVATALFNAVAFIVTGFAVGKSGRTEETIRKSRVIDTRMNVAFKYIKGAKLFDECLTKPDGKVKRKLLVAGVAAVALETLNNPKTREAAQEFWRTVSRNDGLRKGDPRHTLVSYLLTEPLQATSVQAAACAWNAFYENRKLSIIKIPDCNSVRIAGTKFKGD